MIRALTIGLPLDSLSTTRIARRTEEVVERCRSALESASLAPRTLRFTLPPATPEDEVEGRMLSRLRWVDSLAASLGGRWFCQPIDLVTRGSTRTRLAAALDAVVRFDRAFFNLVLATDGEIAVNAARDAARFVLDVSRKSNNGFDNFKVGISCNCPAGAPFFPFSRHRGGDIGFSLALETTPIALRALESGSPEDVGGSRDEIARALVPEIEAADRLARKLADELDVAYLGLDASFAPFPDEHVSVAELVERLSGAPIGSHSSLFATALLTDALREALVRSGARTAGFNGVMFSVLEDTVLASACSRRSLGLDTLLTLSTVCACGLDMIPVPGVSFPEEIAATALDLAALSSTLAKPLGLRLLPIPGAHTHDFTKLHLDFLCDSRVLGLTSNDRVVSTRTPTLAFRQPLRATPSPTHPR